MWIELVKLTSLLLALTMLLTFVFRAIGKDNAKGRFTQGILFGLIAVVGMTMPVNFAPGFIFDPRSVVVSMAGFFGGPFAAIPSALIAGGYRFWLGGAGAIAGMLVVVLSAAAGVADYYLRKRFDLKVTALHLFVFGLASHFIALFGLLTLPNEIMWKVATNLSIAFFLIYPPVTVFLGYLISDIERKFDLEIWLKSSQAQLRSLFDTVPDLIWLKDKGGAYLMCNHHFEEFFGAKEEEIKGRTDYDFVDKELADSFRKKDMEAVESGTHNINEEWVTFAIDGRRALLETVKTPVYDSDSQLVGVLGVAHDITRRSEVESKLRQSEKKLLESEKRLNFALDSSHTGGWDLDLVDHTAHRTLIHDQIFGYESLLPEWTYEMFLEHVLPEDRDEVDNKFQQSMKTRGDWNFECRIRRKDGAIRWIRAAGGHMPDTHGQSRRMGGIVQDITESKLAQADLFKLAQVVEQSPESIIITGVDASIEYVNEAFINNTGYSQQEVYGLNPGILQSGNTPPENFAAMWKALTQGKPWKGELFNRRKNGSEFIEFAIITPIRQADGSISHYVALKEDITEKKRLSQELDQHRHHLEELVTERTEQLKDAREQAEAANQAKSTFLANMSHEIRTPMNAIMGLTYLMQKTSPRPDQSDKLSKIDAATNHLLTIINDILDLSKIEAGKLVLERTNFQLDSIFDHIQSMLNDQAKAKGLTIEVDRDAVPLWLKGDSTRLRQALLNYMSNAIKFTEQGTITLRSKKLQENDGEILVRFEVQDTGIGIAADKIKSLFAAFEQADATTTRQYGGTGLGLTITQSLARLMGGEAGVESEPGRGSTFWFTAWLSRGHAIEPASHSVELENTEIELSAYQSDSHILLVEDNAINSEVASGLLRSAGLTVDTAENGRVAVEKANSNSYDLILMDIQMPEMDGLEATQMIRSLPGKADLPILAMTANAFEQDRQACIKAGMNDFVGKPVDPENLYTLLNKWLKKSDDPREMLTTSKSLTSSQQTEISYTDKAINTLRHAKILLVEDDDLNQEFMQELFLMEGITVELAVNGKEALKLLANHDFDIVLMDCQMPIMDGYQATQKIRKQESLKDLPIIAMTGNSNKEHREKILAIGMNEQISKPIDMNEIFTTMAKWITLKTVKK